MIAVTMAESRAEPEVSSARPGAHVETSVSGHVAGQWIVRMADDYERLGGGPVWLIRGERATSYSADAIREAVRTFGRLARDRGLRRIVAVLASSTIRMGASVVAMSLRAASSTLEICVVKDEYEAETALAQPFGATD